MKIYTPTPDKVIRVRIYQNGPDAKYLTLDNTTIDEALQAFKSLIEAKNLSPFQSGKRISIECREAIGAKNGKAKSIAFKGLTVEETFNMIYAYVTNTKHQKINEEILKSYCVEMGQIISAFLIGQQSAEQVLKSIKIFNEKFN